MKTTAIERRSPPDGIRQRKLVVNNFPLPSSAFNPDDIRISSQYVAPANLKPPRRALRKYSKRAQERMRRAIAEVGVLIPIVVDGKGRIVVGYRRWLAAQDLSLKAVPVIEVSHLTDEQLRISALLDNKLNEDGEWDLDELRLEFAELEDLCTQFDLTIEDTGFTTAELDNLTIGTAMMPEGGTEDDVAGRAGRCRHAHRRCLEGG